MRSLPALISAALLIPSLALAQFTPPSGLPTQDQLNKAKQDAANTAKASQAAADKAAADAAAKVEADKQAAASAAAADKATAEKNAADATAKSKDAAAKAGARAKTTGSRLASRASKLVDINSVGLDVLQKLPGVDAPTAQKIVDGRPWTNKAQLVAKKVLTKANYEKVKAMIVARKAAKPAAK
jgi:DNA uptake protein ComE-like DNA-binding protein